jgi:hypothetical protein
MRIIGLLALALVVALPVMAQGHGSVDGFFTVPERVDTNTIRINQGASSSDQHQRIVTEVTFQRKSGTSWIRIHDALLGDCCNTTGFTALSWTECSGTATGTATYRVKWEAWWYNDAGGVAHHKGPQFSNGRSISNTTCHDDTD